VLPALIGAWLTGVLGGVHCVAMCGGFLAALSGAGASGPGTVAAAPMRSASALAWRQLPYNLGRISSYALLGAVFGAAGGAALAAADLLPVQRALYMIANVFLVLLAVAIAFGGRGSGLLEQAGGALFRRLSPVVRSLALREAPLARYALGMVWGLVPCGLTYSVLPVALFAGGALEGGGVMLAFGLGTLPNLLAAGWLVARARPWLERRAVRYAAALLLVAFAASGFWRAAFGPMAHGQGPFCIVP
jgi:sulfite exporter TauE/SafE